MKEDIKQAVRQGYAATAQAGLDSSQESIQNIARAFGYSPQDLASIPAQANMGLSCGNPIASASLRPGETVLDLGSGGGLDVFLAAKKVGPEGQAIGVDMTAEMVALARKNAEKGDYQNVRFYLGEIEALPLPDQSVDCVISNCVINLCPDKGAALREIYRVLKPGGRLAISDIALRQELPEQVASQVAAWTGCIAGALLLQDYRNKIEQAGFDPVVLRETGSDLNAYQEAGHAACCAPATAENEEPCASEAPSTAADQNATCCGPDPAVSPAEDNAMSSTASGCCGPAPDTTQDQEGDHTAAALHDSLSQVLTTFDVNQYAASVQIFASKGSR